MKRSKKLFFALYQLAGELLLAWDDLTEGQRERLTELLLNVLAEPDRYSASMVRNLRDLAKKP